MGGKSGLTYVKDTLVASGFHPHKYGGCIFSNRVDGKV